ncbi:transcriptional regulator [Nocardia callitridis]|uniref:transcriptional regulator n=1 Tax=Nocardia callitridis TaxID=648753 RepID=UPI0031E711E3
MKLVEHLARHGDADDANRGSGPHSAFGAGASIGLNGDVAVTTRHCLAAALKLNARRVDEQPVQPPEVAGSATRWAREGVALETVLAAYHEEIRSGLEFLAEHSENEAADQFVAAQYVVRVLEMVTVAASTAYVDEHREVAREHQTAAQTLVSALLGGHGIGELARQTGIRIASSYQVVALGIPAHPDERRPGSGALAARRKLRRVQSALATPLGSRALSVLTAAGGTVLVPIEGTPSIAGSLTMTPEVLAVVSEAAEVPVTATVTAGRTLRIPELAGQVHDLLDRVRAKNRPPGLYEVSEQGEAIGCEVPQHPKMAVVTSPNDHRIGRTA